MASTPSSSSPTPETALTFRPAERKDLLALGALYLRAFPQALEEFRSPRLSPRCLADAMGSCLLAEPGSITLAEAARKDRTETVGYVIALADAGRIWRKALPRGLLFLWVLRWLTGRYRLSLRGALSVAGDKLSVWFSWRSRVPGCRSRILSVAVDPGWQGHGVGSELLRVALSRLRARGCECVGLEVRPDNAPALRLYQRAGFRTVGGFRDTRGAWEVMLVPLTERAAPVEGRGAIIRGWLRPRRLLAIAVALGLLAAGRAWFSSYLSWRQDLKQAGFVDEMPEPVSSDRILVVAPHPDDETLGCGGLIEQAVAAGADVHVILMTNGDASELAAILGEREFPLNARAYLDLGKRRQEESLKALALLGLPRSHVHFLSYPNNGLAALWRPEHWLYSHRFTSPYTKVSASPYPRSFTPQAPYCGLQVLSDLVSLLNQLRPTAVYVTHPRDIHPDHWATDTFARYALATVSARGGRWADQVTVYGYLVHWPQYPAPSRVSLRMALVPPSELAGPHAGWLRLQLSAEASRRKLKAIWAYRSQTPRFDRLLLRFARANESFALLRPTTMQAGVSLIWRDDKSGLRHLGGAEITAVGLTVLPGGALKADIHTAARKLAKRSYVSLDLRGWDENQAPAITNVTVSRGSDIAAVRILGNREEKLGSVQVSFQPLGRIRLSGVGLPPSSVSEGFFVNCWGSAADKLVDALVVSRVTLAGEAKH